MKREIIINRDGRNEIKPNSFRPQGKANRQTYDYMIKLIIIGDTGVGKTNIISRFCAKEQKGEVPFKQHHVATIGVDFSTKLIEVQDKRIKLQIWDTAGQQRFKTITETYYKGAAGIILVYSVDSEQSFKSIEKWMNQVNSKASDGVKKILVANKIDLDQNIENDYEQQRRKISTQIGKKFAQEHKIKYMESSAKNDEGISDIFLSLAAQIKQRIEKEEHLHVDNNGDVSVSITLDSKNHRSFRKIQKDGIEYKTDQKCEENGFAKNLKNKICTC